MGMFSRITTLFKSNVNSALNKLEDPEKVLEQNILDMESEYAKAKLSVSKAKAEELRLTKKINNLNNEIEKWTTNAKLALSKQNEDLARKALSKKQDLVAEIGPLTSDRDQIKNQVSQLLTDLKVMENKIAEAKRKKNLIQTRLETAKAKKKIVETKAKVGSIGEGAFSSFAKMEEKANKMINEADALEEVNESLQGEDLDAEFDKLNSNSDVENELEKLKNQMK